MNTTQVVIGEDGGSTSTKATVLNANTGQYLDSIYVSSRGMPAEAGLQILGILGGAHPEWDVVQLWTTGSSRQLLLTTHGGDGKVSEIVAQVRGVHEVFPGVRSIFDLGGLDSKAIETDEFGRIKRFAMNPICGAATGQAIENQCNQAGCASLLDFDKVALKSLDPANFNTRCFVMMVANWIAHQAQGVLLEDRVMGFLVGIAKCFINNTVHKSRLDLDDRIAFVGMPAGLMALRKAMKIAAEQYLYDMTKSDTEVEIVVPNDPAGIYKATAAYGAALIALDKYRENGKPTQFRGLDGIKTPRSEQDTCVDCANRCSICRYYDPDNGKYLYTSGRQCAKS